MQSMVDFIVPNDRVAPRSDLYTRKRVSMDIVILQNTTPICKEVHTPLKSPVNLVILKSGIAFASDPHASVGIGEYLVLDKLTSSLN